MITAVFSGDKIAVQILPYKCQRWFGGRSRQNLDRGCLEKGVRLPSHPSGDYEVHATFLKPWRQEPWLMFRSQHLGRRCRLLRSQIDVDEGEFFAMPEVLGKSSVGNRDSNSHRYFVLSIRTIELRWKGAKSASPAPSTRSHQEPHSDGFQSQVCCAILIGATNTYTKVTLNWRQASGRKPGPGQDEFFGLLGGVHLWRSTRQELETNGNAIGRRKFQIIAPCHCTGFGANSYLRTRFNSLVQEVGVGTRLHFGER